MVTPGVNQGYCTTFKGYWNKGWEFYNTDVPAAVRLVGDAEWKSFKSDAIKCLALFALSAFAVVYVTGIKTLCVAIVLTVATTVLITALVASCFHVFTTLVRASHG